MRFAIEAERRVPPSTESRDAPRPHTCLGTGTGCSEAHHAGTVQSFGNVGLLITSGHIMSQGLAERGRATLRCQNVYMKIATHTSGCPPFGGGPSSGLRELLGPGLSQTNDREHHRNKQTARRCWRCWRWLGRWHIAGEDRG